VGEIEFDLSSNRDCVPGQPIASSLEIRHAPKAAVATSRSASVCPLPSKLWRNACRSLVAEPGRSCSEPGGAKRPIRRGARPAAKVASVDLRPDRAMLPKRDLGRRLQKVRELPRRRGALLRRAAARRLTRGCRQPLIEPPSRSVLRRGCRAGARRRSMFPVRGIHEPVKQADPMPPPRVRRHRCLGVPARTTAHRKCPRRRPTVGVCRTETAKVV
jgi:hypothetical protein